MIVIKLNEANFEYDIHSLVKAFFPAETVVVSVIERLGQEPLTLRAEVDYMHGGGAPDAIHMLLSGADGCIQAVERQVDFSERGETKNKLKRLLYQHLSAYTKKSLPWGTLTGIRPTKIPMMHLEAGRDDQWIRGYMADTYFVSSGKIDLSLGIAKRELAILRELDYVNGYSLYIGIPFCPSTCLYCSFTSYPIGKAEQVEAYLEALHKELAAGAKAFQNKTLNTIYIGGGTPTALSEKQLDRLLTVVGRLFDCANLAEFTVEAGRPDSITLGKLAVLKQHGVSRISINPQTMKPETLHLIGRHHTPQQIWDRFLQARSLGFDHINMDLIIGLPQESRQDVLHTMEQIKELEPDSITVHALARKRGSRLAMEWEAGQRFEQPEAAGLAQMIDATAACAQDMGLFPYYLYRQKNMAGNFENVGYAKPGKAGIYNMLMMEDKQTILALGAGSISKFIRPGQSKPERTVNVKDIEHYLRRVEEMIARREAVMSKYD